MAFLDQWYRKRERQSKRIYEIDNDLYEGLKRLSEIYEASVTELINAAMEFLIETENIALIQKDKIGPRDEHALKIRESNSKGFDDLKDKYGVNIGKLVNIAIQNLLEDSVEALDSHQPPAPTKPSR